MPEIKNPIALGRTAQVFSWENDTVLKLFFDWVPESWITHEFRVARLVSETGLDIPAVVGEIVTLDGRKGICYQKVDGESMMQHISTHPFKLFSHTSMMGKLHAGMHSRSGIGLPSQHEKLHYKIKDADPLPDDLKGAALLALEKLPQGDRLCHGDFHPGNILMTNHGPVIIDWTDASCGNPISDVARTLVLITAAQLPLDSLFGWILKFGRHLLINSYTRNYFHFAKEDHSQLDAWIPVVAAARLNEEIPEEYDQLLNIVRQGLK